MRKWFRTARENAGFTMKQLSERLLISESYYCAIENGTRQRDMDISLAQRIAQALDTPIKSILEQESELRNHRG